MCSILVTNYEKVYLIPTWSGNYQGSKTGVREDPTSDSDSDMNDELERADDTLVEQTHCIFHYLFYALSINILNL